ncbi:antirestriction protein ArdA [Cronobacter sakazakii]|uniref:antirestriction protein ArdA n=1 Tax=Cronobacter sakazakii TaxID=28141 RepID=UPI0015763F01|nr:antirestriction protein ArdA [Cronobacter sakazakii]MEB8610279.1 antirestriction protein ArdA [Cronobacter sakazakii]
MSTTTPAVYVGTYHKYNCGSIFGQWFDLTDFDDKDEFQEACRALHANEADPEFMYQDWEGIPSNFASESSVDWAFIDAYKRARDAGRDAAFIAWADYCGECDYDAFDDAYRGEAESEEAFAQQHVEDCGLLNDLPESLRGYFDYEAYGRDLFMDSYVLLDGHVFSR